MSLDMAAELRAERARKGMTLDDLADALGTTKDTVSRKTRGTTPLTWEDVERFAAALGTTPSALVLDAEKHAVAAA